MPACEGDQGTLPLWSADGATATHTAQYLTDCLLEGRPSGVVATVGW